MKITVVCPTYNSQAYIAKAVACLLSQTWLPAEVVFSDDGSTDETVRVLEECQNDFEARGVACRVLRGRHRGPGAARNAGVAQAAGEWIAFLDADDLWSADKLEKVAHFVEKTEGINCVLHWESYLKKNEEAEVLRHGEVYKAGTSLARELYRNNFFSTSAVVCEKRLVDEAGGFDETLPNGQDYELWLRMSPGIHLGVLSEVLGSYVEHADSITARPYARRWFSLMRILVRHRSKGGWGLFLYRILRATFSRQWGRGLVNWLKGERKH